MQKSLPVFLAKNYDIIYSNTGNSWISILTVRKCCFNKKLYKFSVCQGRTENNSISACQPNSILVMLKWISFSLKFSKSTEFFKILKKKENELYLCYGKWILQIKVMYMYVCGYECELTHVNMHMYICSPCYWNVFFLLQA